MSERFGVSRNEPARAETTAELLTMLGVDASGFIVESGGAMLTRYDEPNEGPWEDEAA